LVGCDGRAPDGLRRQYEHGVDEPVRTTERNVDGPRLPGGHIDGIPDNVGLIVLGSTVALPASYSVLVVNNSTQNSAFFNPVGRRRIQSRIRIPSRCSRTRCIKRAEIPASRSSPEVRSACI